MPASLGVRFRVTRLLWENSMGHEYVEAVFLTGPFAGESFQATYLFLPPGEGGVEGGPLVVGPDVEPCD